ncbi:ABC transporter ATP-binding protein [Actinacidiphila guanduensis]|uniref:NitT/TauT family transport system ATP-binding protein/sulfonate transport system ATP-binding protein n=1 Tax=Actinacidiphila guanduensis TaxID=310781 RepID=A0A1H0HTN9_9ACTN|nr:ABC transporter ATP-binding protein [Actinacidiphila guanduensis]SDO22479.1 NitT/TauT family transport system ATP-binding protein/sulfonate transport system ATP-binding protein [Actinacidiphila guanduensis]
MGSATTPARAATVHDAPDPGRPVIEIAAARTHYATPAGPLPVLDGVDLAVRPGEVVAVVGPSGCGKTTLLRVLQGLAPLDSGEVAVHGAAPGGAAETGYVFQQPSLFPWWNVRRNIEFGLKLRARGRRTSAAERRAQADRLLEIVGLTGFHDFRPAALSGGMQQRVNLARALAIDPAVLLLDEPFSAVDTLTRERLQRVLSRTLHALGTAAVIVTHDIREAVFLGDRVAVMSERPGRIVATFTVDHPRPRTEDFQHGEQLAAIAARVYRHLKDGDERAHAEQAAPAADAPHPEKRRAR